MLQQSTTVCKIRSNAASIGGYKAFNVSHLSLIGIQSFAVAANFTVEVPELLCQLHGLMGAESVALIVSELIL